MKFVCSLFWLLPLLLISKSVLANDQILIASSSNFSAPLKEIIVAFEKETKIKCQFSSESSKKLATQIINGAPFDVFLSADQDSISELINKNKGIRNTRFSYAKGQLVLWSRSSNNLEKIENLLTSDKIKKIALADPNLAPYGKATVSYLKNLNIYEKIKSKLVYGNNIAQTFQFVDTENAQVGFVALSQIIEKKQEHYVIIPEIKGSEIIQDAILLKETAQTKKFLDYLKSDQAKIIIKKYGYKLID